MDKKRTGYILRTQRTGYILRIKRTGYILLIKELDKVQIQMDISVTDRITEYKDALE